MSHSIIKFFNTPMRIAVQRFYLFLVAVVLLCACSPLTFEANLYDFGVITQPASPLIPGSDSILPTYYWELREITYRDEPVSLDGLERIYVAFFEGGFLHIWTFDPCSLGSYRIIATSANEYRLIPAVSAAGACSVAPEILARLHEITRLLAMTNEYRLNAYQLVLSNQRVGNEIHADLTAEHPDNVLAEQ